MDVVTTAGRAQVVAGQGARSGSWWRWPAGPKRLAGLPVRDYSRCGESDVARLRVAWRT